MTASPPTVESEIERYVFTGEHDPHHAAWPGGFMERVLRAHQDMREALVREVRRRTADRVAHRLPTLDTVDLTKRKVEPMVRGLFPKAERDVVLGVLERSVIFVTSTNIEQILMDANWHRSAWEFANLYLESIGAELLGPNAPRIVGISEDTTCYVSMEYFEESDPFADFLVHEAAHIFHNCKRRTAGLRETRRREWLLDIAFAKRETFAYSCEAYARILERAQTPAERRTLAADFAATARIADERVDADEVADILREAAASRNGWKVILVRCAPAGRRGTRRQAPIDLTARS